MAIMGSRAVNATKCKIVTAKYRSAWGPPIYLPSRQRAQDAGGDAHGGPLNALGGNQKKKDQKGVI